MPWKRHPMLKNLFIDLKPNDIVITLQDENGKTNGQHDVFGINIQLDKTISTSQGSIFH